MHWAVTLQICSLHECLNFFTYFLWSKIVKNYPVLLSWTTPFHRGPTRHILKKKFGVFLGCFGGFSGCTWGKIILKLYKKCPRYLDVSSCKFLASWLSYNMIKLILKAHKLPYPVIMTSSRDCDVISRDQNFLRYFTPDAKRLSITQSKPHPFTIFSSV